MAMHSHSSRRKSQHSRDLATTHDDTSGLSHVDVDYDPYPRSYSSSRRTENYHNSASTRLEYSMEREGSSSGRRDDWRTRGSYSSRNDRYGQSPHGDTYSRHRDDYYETSDRGTDRWDTVESQGHYSSSRSWALEKRDYDSAYATTAPTTSWIPPARHTARADNPSWRADNDRAVYDSDQHPDRYNEDGRGDDGQSAHLRMQDSHRSSWREDWRDVSSVSGSSRTKERDSRKQWSEDLASRGKREYDDRPWEPAPSWKPDSTVTHSTKSKKSKGKNKKTSQKRDWRQDDGQPNNWQRRDAKRDTKNEGWSKKSEWSTIRHSRSSSPVLTLKSKRPSRDRSRSDSPSPKRRRRDTASNRRSPSPIYIGSGKSKADATPTYVRSNGRGRARLPSISSRSSPSGSETSSRSPSPDRPKTLHRLPVATSVKDLTASFVSKRRKGSLANPPLRFERSDINIARQVEKTTQLLSGTTDKSVPSVSSSVAVPPQDLHGHETAQSGKNAGFKPIGQGASSSLKRFFPQEEQEEDVENKDTSTSTPLHGVVASTSPCKIAPDRSSVGAESQGRQQRSVETRVRQALSPSHNVPGQGSVSPGHGSVRTSHGQEFYSIVSQVGEGTFGKVYKARNSSTGTHVALKRIRMESERDGFPVTAMREIKLLQSLRQDNVVQLHEMMVSNGSVYMVFEYMDHDLTGILSQSQFNFTDAHLKSLCHQMLAGLAYLHRKGVIHRDIKGSNILINNRGELKLGDFGLARFYQKRRRSDYTNRVITLWYRPPELLLGATVYGPEVDMWSAGCIMLELFTKKPVFQGNDEIDQLDVIYRLLGTPTLDSWSSIVDTPWYELMKPKEPKPNHFREIFRRWLSPAGVDLAEGLLSFNPERRVSAAEALQAPYFTKEQPPAAPPNGLSSLKGEWHELETKREREAKKRRKKQDTII